MNKKRKLSVSLLVVLTVASAYVSADWLRGLRARPSTTPDPAAQILAVETAPSQGALSECLLAASQLYNVPISVLTGIMRVEGGHAGQAVANTDGTSDLGVMQVNSIWVPQLARLWNVDYATAYGAVRDDGCENIYIGSWILKQKIAQTGTLYNGIAYYHSARKKLGGPYANKVISMMWAPEPILFKR
jgi:soluble lytic murein transglycosylase-like protein